MIIIKNVYMSTPRIIKNLYMTNLILWAFFHVKQTYLVALLVSTEAPNTRLQQSFVKRHWTPLSKREGERGRKREKRTNFVIFSKNFLNQFQNYFIWWFMRWDLWFDIEIKITRSEQGKVTCYYLKSCNAL